MNFPDEDVCLKSILECFQPLVDKYNYTYEIDTYKKFNVVVIYKNLKEDCLIRVENCTDYADYGFGIRIASPISAHMAKSKDFRTIVIIPFTEQDKDCIFIKNAAKDFFEKMTDVYALVPKDKSDNSNIERLKRLDDKEIEPILPALLEWIQDCNWPVAGDILPVLALHQSALIPLIHRVLSPEEKDGIWKYWIIDCLLPLFSEKNIQCILPDIERIANEPTHSEITEETNEAAVLFLQDRLKKK